MSMALMNKFHELHKQALAEQDYESSMVFTTAEDLTDGLLKGGPASGPERLLSALTSNRDRLAGTPEGNAWALAVTVAEEFFTQP